MKAVMAVAGVQSLLLVVYPEYNAIFLRLEAFTQGVFVLLLPLIKYAMIVTINRAGNPAASGIKTIAVELFDALYLFKCMQSTGSLLAEAGLILIDVLHSIYHLRNLHKHVQHVKQELHKRGRSINHKQMILNSIDRVTHSQLRLQSSNSTYLSNRTVVPSSATKAIPIVPAQAIKSAATLPQLDKSVLKLLTKCEHLVMIEFIQCVVPMFNAVYMFSLFHLPVNDSRRSGLDTRAKTEKSGHIQG